jgi:hypothetical protein
MAITVSVVNGPSFRIEGDAATIGSDSNCAISLPHDARLKPQHALLRQVAGRWMIESKSGDEIRIGDQPPSKVKWLTPGDSIDLTGRGPLLVFQTSNLPVADVTLPAATSASHGRGSVANAQSDSSQQTPGLALSPSARAPILWACCGAALVVAGLMAALLIFPATRNRTDDGRAGNGNPDATSQKPVASQVSGADTSSLSPLPTDPLPVGRLPDGPLPSTAPPAASLDKLLGDHRDALYAVTLEAPEHDQTYRLGSAGAISPTALVTSAAIGIEIEDAKESLPTVSVSTADFKHEYEVLAVKVHPAYRTADDDADAATNELHAVQADLVKDPNKADVEQLVKRQIAALERLHRAFEMQAAFDLAVIEVKGPLPKSLDLALPADAKPGAGVWLAGLPFQTTEFLVDRDQPGQVRGTKGSVFLKQPLPQSPEPAARLLVKFTEDLNGQNWSGCPVFNAAGKVVAVYSRPTPPMQTNDGDTPPPTHDVSDIAQLKVLLPSP